MWWWRHSLLQKDLEPSAILDRPFWINEKYSNLRKIRINQSNHDRKIDLYKRLLKNPQVWNFERIITVKHSLEHKICYLVILKSCFFFSNQTLKGLFHTNSYLTINEWGWVSYEELWRSRRVLSVEAVGLGR